MMKTFDNKIALITGGGSGIGKAVSTSLSNQGAIVYIMDVDEQNGNKVAIELETLGCQSYYKKCNLANQLEVKRIIEAIGNENSNVDRLINNAGTAHIGTAETTI